MDNTIAEIDGWTYSDVSIECLESEHELSKYAEGVYIELRAGDTVVVEPVLRGIGHGKWIVADALRL